MISDQCVDVLIVDDRQDGLLALEAALRNPRWNLVKASSGHEALKILDTRDFAVILLDVQMPGIDGFETAARIRSGDHHRHTPIIFVTAINQDESYVHRGYQAGAVDYVFKPFDPHILHSKVEVFVDFFLMTKKLEQQADLIRESERRERYLRLAELEVESLRRLQSLADAVPHIIWKARAEGVLDYVNRVWTDFTGLTLEQSQGVGWQAAINPDDLKKTLRLWLQAMSAKEPFETEVRIRHRDGEYRWHILKVVPEMRAGEVVSWIGSNTEIHGRKLMEERLLKTQSKAEAANQAKTNFLANMSHEIRTPLNAILGFAELILEPGQSSEESLRCAHTIHRSGRQLLRIIDEILDISKIEAGHMNIEKIDVDVPQLIEDVRSLLQLQAAEKGLLLEFKLAKAIPRRIVSDPTRLKQILMNLVGNAVKFTEKGRITVEIGWVESHEGCGEFCARIQDTGPGIAQADAERLFKPFMQVDSSTTRRFGGTGLGLALSKRLAQLLGGDVLLESSTPGEGSVFIAKTPCQAKVEHGLVKSFETAMRPQSPTPSKTSLEGLRILLVDDSPDNQVLIGRFLKSAGANVDLAGNGLEAVDKALAEPYEVVLMDIQMPYMDGYDATHRLRSEGYDGPIVALTAHALKEEREKCLAVGCTSHLTKPIEKSALIDHVAQLARATH